MKAELSSSQANVAVRRLFPKFDLPIDPYVGTAGPLLIAFARRGIRLYEESVRLASRSPEASVGVLRSLVDMTITAKWMEGAPRCRARLFFADDDLTRLRTMDEWDLVRAARGHPPTNPPVFDAIERSRMERRARRLRRLARNAGERIGPRERDPLVPSIRTRADSAGDAIELYFLFGLLSQSTHVTARAFSFDQIDRRPTGAHVQSKAAIKAEAIRMVAVPAICFLLASISRQLGLGHEAELDDLRVRIAGWTSP